MGDLGLGPYIASECALSFDHIVLCDPRKEFRLKQKLNSKEEDEKDGGGPGDTLWSRLKWSIKLLFTPRLIGWTHEPTFILPPRPRLGTTRTQFILSTSLQILVCAIIEAITYTLNVFNPALNPYTSIWDYKFKYRVLAVLGYAGNAYARMNISYRLLAVLFVALRLTNPEEWPRLFGGIREAWCVGRFWSRTWHHILRRTLTSMTNTFLAPNGGSFNVLFRLMSAFFFSGLIHTAGEHMMAGQFSTGSQIFFMLQPFAIVFERAVLRHLGFFGDIRGGRKPNLVIRVLGHVWVLTWFSLTVPIIMQPIVKTGMFLHRRENGGLGCL
ncbi:membrane bound O-acyl transferase family-domain-containing protein [Cyathus striatus]|nr:membrane bound O-acyl transferase family-domain-containing protein [Cyathus striatus]